MDRKKKSITILLCIMLVFVSIPFQFQEVYAASSIVEIAKGEVGVSGSPNKYTRWNGLIGGSYDYAWCQCFASWCAEQAGLSAPKTASCSNAAAWFVNNGRWASRSSGYVPQAGDFIYFDWNNNGGYDHVGIVNYVSNGRVYTIEGNAKNAVKYNGGYSNGYSMNDTQIIGYGKMQESPQITVEVDSRFSTPLICYTLSTGNITTYQYIDTPFSSASYITGSTDQCTIQQVYTNGWVKVSYPVTSGTKTAYAKLSDFISSGVEHYNVEVSGTTAVYRRSDLSETLGEVYTTDNIVVVGKSGSSLQIIYPISGGYKMGWIQENAVKQQYNNLSLRVWVSDSKMGTTPSAFRSGKTYYLCYQIINNDTGNVIVHESGLDYDVTETIYNEDGSVANTCTYDNSTDNWIGLTVSANKNYKGVVTVSGDINFTGEISWKTVAPAVKVWFSDVPNGESVSTIVEGQTGYLCYLLIDKNTGKDLDSVVDYDYTASLSIVNENGTSIKTGSFTEDRQYIAANLNSVGTYTGKLVLTGEFNTTLTDDIIVEKSEEPLAISGKTNTNSTIRGNKVTITSTASGGDESYTYRYLLYNKDTQEWSYMTTYISSNTYVWTPDSAGNYEVYVQVKDGTGKALRSSGMSVIVKNPVLKISEKVSVTGVEVGEELTITGTASGGSGSYTYSFLVHNTATNAWSRLKDFDSSNKFIWTAGSAGNREFYVEVRDSEGTVVRSAPVTVTVTEVVSELEITGKISTATVNEGQKVTITGTASGGSGSYTYSYLVYNKATGTWARLTPSFVKNKTFTWTAGNKGDRTFYVEVKDSTGKVARSKALDVSVTEVVKELAITGKTNTSVMNEGEKVTITGTASGGSGSYTYSYLVYNKETGIWARLTPSFIKNNTFTWTAGRKGNRTFYVEAKDSTGKIVRSKALDVSVTEAVKELTVTGKTSVTAMSEGEKVTITGTASGGSGSYTYSYLVHNRTTGTWARLTPSFVKSNTFTWTAGSTGNRDFYIEAKDSTGKVVRSKAVTISVKGKELSITSKSSAATVTKGSKVVLTGTASGGSGDYTYSYLVYNKDTETWARLTPSFINNKTFTWTAGSKGDRVFYVEVKDSAGKVVRSSAVAVSVK